MNENRDAIAAYIDAAGKLLVATAYDVREGRLWEGERDRKIAEALDLLKRVPNETR